MSTDKVLTETSRNDSLVLGATVKSMNAVHWEFAVGCLSDTDLDKIKQCLDRTVTMIILSEWMVGSSN